jgi:hypothetical protein
MFGTVSAKILIMGYNIQKKSVKISVIFLFHRGAICSRNPFKLGANFRAYRYYVLL